MITHAKVCTNGFSYIVSGKVRTQEKHFMLHVSPRYGNELIELTADQANIFPRRVDDRHEAARVKQELISALLTRMQVT